MKEITALILCGGKGERLRPLTVDLPKPLVDIDNYPILGYLVDHIKKFNIRNIVVAVGYKAYKIQEFFRDKYTDLNISIVDSGDVDIVDRITDCSSYIKGDFIVFYGDTLANIDIVELQKYHYTHSKKLTMTLCPLKSQFGLVELDADSNVVEFMEKPTLDKWVNIGGFYCEQGVFEWMKDYSSYVDFLEATSFQKKIKGYKHTGVHITVNTLQELEDAKNDIHFFK